MFASDYRVKICPVGAEVASASSSTTINVHPGHGFTDEHKFIVNLDTGRFRDVVAVTSTTIEVSEAVSVAAGEFLINLGADPGSTEPEFTSTPIVVYLDSGYVDQPADSTVSTDSTGRYRYWHKGIARWELVLTTTMTPIAFYTDTDGPADEDQVSYGVRYAHLFADGGTGTEDDPWTLTGSNPVQAAYDDFGEGFDGARVIRCIGGVYDLGSADGAVTITSATENLEGITIEGYGMGTTETDSYDGATIFVYSGTGSAFKLGDFTTANKTTAFCTFRNFKVLQTGTDGTGKGFLCRLVRQTTFESVLVEDMEYGWALASVSDFNTFRKCSARDCATAAAYVGFTTGMELPNGQCNANLFHECDFMNLARDAGRTNYGIFIDTDSVQNVVRDSRFHNFDTTDTAAIICRASNGLVVDSNYFEGNYFSTWIQNAGATDFIGFRFTNNYVTQIESVGFRTNCGSSGLIHDVVVSGNHFTNPSMSSPYNASTGVVIHANTRNVGIGTNHYVNMATADVTFGGTSITYVRHESGILYVSDQIRFGDGADADFAIVADTATDNGTLTYLGASAVNDWQFNKPLRVPTLRNVAATAATIASGVLTPTQGYHTVTGEGGAADDLVTITWSGVLDGTHLYLRPTSDAVDITVKHGTGNIFLTGHSDLVMDRAEDTIHLLFNGTSWVQVGGGSNRA